MVASRQRIYAKLALMDMEQSDLPRYSVQHLERLVLLLSRKLHSLRTAKVPVLLDTGYYNPPPWGGIRLGPKVWSQTTR